MNGIRRLTAALLLSVLLGACGGEKSKQAEATAPAADATAAAGSSGATQRPAVSPIVEAARSQGVSQCLPRVQKLADTLTQGATFRAYAVTDDKRADERLYALVLSRLNSQNTHQLVSVTVTPDKACSATYDVSTVWGAPCAQVAQQFFPSFKPVTPLPGNVSVLQGPPLQQVFLLATPGGGCLTLRKETLY